MQHPKEFKQGLEVGSHSCGSGVQSVELRVEEFEVER